jgi:hypothetical protein
MNEKSFSGADFKPHRVNCPSCGKGYTKDEPWKMVCLKCYLKTKGRTDSRVRTEPIEPGMLRRLLQCCHPDKHGNSEASNIATKYLLQLREVQHG